MGSAGSPSRGAHAVAPPPPLAHALSGAVGAVVAMALLYPLDQVRAVLQVRSRGSVCALLLYLTICCRTDAL